MMTLFRWIIPAVVFVLVSGCGYQFEGGGYLNTDIRRVAVKAFENRSSETGAGMKFTNALIEEISRKTDTQVVDESVANYVIEAVINSVTFSILSRSTTDSVAERNVSAVVDLKIKNRDGDIVWSVKDFSSNDEYTVSSNTATDDSNKQAALDEIATRSAERLVSRMLNNF